MALLEANAEPFALPYQHSAGHTETSHLFVLKKQWDKGKWVQEWTGKGRSAFTVPRLLFLECTSFRGQPDLREIPSWYPFSCA